HDDAANLAAAQRRIAPAADARIHAAHGTGRPHAAAAAGAARAAARGAAAGAARAAAAAAPGAAATAAAAAAATRAPSAAGQEEGQGRRQRPPLMRSGRQQASDAASCGVAFLWARTTRAARILR